MSSQVTKEKDPTLQEWRELYDAAAEFKRRACWQWVDNTDIFGVRDPESGVNYFCTVMGGGDLEFGVLAYRGTAGLDLLFSLIQDDGEEDPEMDEIRFQQDSLCCSFEDRDQLEKRDLAVIKSLGLKFRGRKEWPYFRDYSPGLSPWFLTGAQSRTLVHILQQVMVVTLECKRVGGTDFLRGGKGEFLIRTPEKTSTGLSWTDRYWDPNDEVRRFLRVELSDRLLIQKIKKLPLARKLTLELDLFFLPATITDKDRPYFPRTMGIADHGTGELICMELLEEEDPLTAVVDVLLDMLVQMEVRPRCILVKRQELMELLFGLGKQIGIEVKRSDELPNIRQVRRGFNAYNQL